MKFSYLLPIDRFQVYVICLHWPATIRFFGGRKYGAIAGDMGFFKAFQVLKNTFDLKLIYVHKLNNVKLTFSENFIKIRSVDHKIFPK